MLKEARKPSSDPAQEKLRQDKANWNKEVSALINDIIHLKKTMNGWPSKFYQQRTRITEPIPADPATIIGSLVGDFQELAQRGNHIVQEQLTYSKNRRQKQPKQLNLPHTEQQPAPPQAEPAKPQPDLSKQLSLPLSAELEMKYGLISEGSNPITRFFTKMITPTRGSSQEAGVRRLRMSLLTAAAKTYKELSKLQAAAVGSSKESSTAAHKQMQHTWNQWSLVTRGFAAFKMVLPAGTPDAGGPLEGPSLMADERPEDPDRLDVPSVRPPAYNVAEMMALAKSAYADYKRALSRNNFTSDGPLFQNLDALLGRYLSTPAKERAALAQSIVEEHRRIVAQINTKYGTSGNTLNQIADILDAKAKADIPPGVHMPKAASAADQLEAVAQTFLKKWVGKTRHQWMPKETSSQRLQIYSIAGEARKNINQIMDLLEKGMDTVALTPLIQATNAQMTSLRMLVRSVHLSEKPEQASQYMTGF